MPVHLLMCVMSSPQSGKLSGDWRGNPVAIANEIFAILPQEEIQGATSFGDEDAVLASPEVYIALLPSAGAYACVRL